MIYMAQLQRTSERSRVHFKFLKRTNAHNCPQTSYARLGQRYVRYPANVVVIQSDASHVLLRIRTPRAR